MESREQKVGRYKIQYEGKKRKEERSVQHGGAKASLEFWPSRFLERLM
jgi:hypothetical protein